MYQRITFDNSVLPTAAPQYAVIVAIVRIATRRSFRLHGSLPHLRLVEMKDRQKHGDAGTQKDHHGTYYRLVWISSAPSDAMVEDTTPWENGEG